MPRKRLPRGWVIRDGLLGRDTAAREIRTTAIHEAAHAVASHVVGERVVHLQLTRFAGKQNARRWRGWCSTFYQKRHGRIDPVARGIIALAGHEAEIRFCGRPKHLVPKGDFDIVKKLGCSMSSINGLAAYARQIVRWYAPHVKAVAKELEARGSMTRRQFLKTYRAV